MARRRKTQITAADMALLSWLFFAAMAGAIAIICLGAWVFSYAASAAVWLTRSVVLRLKKRPLGTFPAPLKDVYFLRVKEAAQLIIQPSEEYILPPAYPSPKPSPHRAGIDFEAQCAAAFRFHGWQVTATPTSGDHGADLILRRGNRIVAVQCKNYKGRAGNRAVQEVYAARSYYQAQEAVVICPGGFTRHAEQMASRIGVRLQTAP
ncbi:restriction endonuclease [Gluconobacter thailandicus]|uniref:Restriction endonuclease n=1 Tax=Gluconobacter thailandicus TaxID=257438 RepID=A0AAP9EV43_GLUTH|nr:restriction endonuclease [Gluconobacter thailandicus]QEH97282.1 restriction endonuclease [Gluconobacter thailandicus]